MNKHVINHEDIFLNFFSSFKEHSHVWCQNGNETPHVNWLLFCLWLGVDRFILSSFLTFSHWYQTGTDPEYQIDPSLHGSRLSASLPVRYLHKKNYWVRENVSNRAGANVYVTFLHGTTRVSEWVPASLGGRRQITVQWIKQGQGLHLPQPRPWAYPINQTAIPLTVHHSAPETMCMCALRLQQSLLPRSDYRLFMPSLPRSGEQSVLSTDRRSAEPSQWGRMKVENPQNRWWQTGCRVLAGHCCINNRTKIQVM